MENDVKSDPNKAKVSMDGSRSIPQKGSGPGEAPILSDGSRDGFSQKEVSDEDVREFSKWLGPLSTRGSDGPVLRRIPQANGSDKIGHTRCDNCGKLLMGQQTKWCSERCRKTFFRKTQQLRREDYRAYHRLMWAKRKDKVNPMRRKKKPIEPTTQTPEPKPLVPTTPMTPSIPTTASTTTAPAPTPAPPAEKPQEKPRDKPKERNWLLDD